MTKNYDVIIIGAGTWGGAAAWQLAERGSKVLTIDAFRPPHGNGSHGGATRLVRNSNSMGPEYSELSRQVVGLWDDIERRTGTQVMLRTGNLLVGAPGSWAWDRTMANMADAPYPYEILTTDEARSRFPRLNIQSGELALWEPEGSVGIVPAALDGMQNLARSAGAHFRFEESVTGWDVDQQGVTVTTDEGSYRAARLVVTAGAFSKKVLNMDLPTRTVRQVLANFEVDPAASVLPSMYFAGPVGVDITPNYGCAEPDGSFKFSVPTVNDVLEPEDLNQNVTEEDVRRITDAVSSRIPELAGKNPTSTTACMWTEVSDGHWLIGTHPASDRVIIGAGCNGRGFKYAPAIGSILADLTEGIDHPELARFRADRFAAVS